METGEIFGWIIFMMIITLLFFAAFGGSSYDEDDIDEYMENIMSDIRKGENR